VRAAISAPATAMASSSAAAPANGFAAVRLAREQRPDVVLMDIRMPGLDGIAATRETARDPALASVHVLILTTFGLDEYIFDALRAGRGRVPGQGHRRGRTDPRGAGDRAQLVVTAYESGLVRPGWADRP
jgi:CheY-like chemotaxis protein